MYKKPRVKKNEDKVREESFTNEYYSQKGIMTRL